MCVDITVWRVTATSAVLKWHCHVSLPADVSVMMWQGQIFYFFWIFFLEKEYFWKINKIFFNSIVESEKNYMVPLIPYITNSSLQRTHDTYISSSLSHRTLLFRK